MRSSEMDSPSTQSEANAVLELRLYIVGGALNSLRALTNLQAICEERFAGYYRLEVVDIFDDPLRAIADKILMTPMLIKLAPAPQVKIAGDLSVKATVIVALQKGP
ncbi:MAG: circadian clock KaiB family protein [Aggregatilineales bacterium]